MAGRQCDKLLWLRVHEPSAPELRPDASLAAVFAAGHAVGALARAHAPGGTLIELDPHKCGDALRATESAVLAGATTLYEACFDADDTFVAIDILERMPGGRAWALVEVKATLSAKPEHLVDLAVQVHVARRAGHEIARVEVMHLNRDHRHPDREPLFVRYDVTDAVEAIVPTVAKELARQLRVIGADMPDVTPGPQCSTPHDCPFALRCQGSRRAYDVNELYGMWSRAAELRARGYETIYDIPDPRGLHPVAARQWQAVRSSKPVVEEGLGDALRALPTPLAFLDFETIAPAIPVWTGTAPYQCIAVQHSVHRLAPDGSLTHHEFLAEGPDDPRDALVAHLLGATASAATVLAWHAPFERDRIVELAEALPHCATALMDLHARIVDLRPLVRDHVYHPEFHGSFSLKQVGPALVPDLTYRDLEIADGGTASRALQAYVLHSESAAPEHRQSLRRQLLAYCERDTLILVRMLAVLQALAEAQDDALRARG